MFYIKISTEKVGLSFVSRSNLTKLKLVTDFLLQALSWNGACNKKRQFPTASFLFRNFMSPYQTFEVTSVTLAQQSVRSKNTVLMGAATELHFSERYNKSITHGVPRLAHIVCSEVARNQFFKPWAVYVLYTVNVKQSHYRPAHVLGVPEGWGSQISRQSPHEGGKVVSPTHRPPLPQEIFMALISVRGRVKPRAIARPEGLC
jgi:hypothetical protein